MKQTYQKSPRGFTLVECLAAMLILMVAFTGIIGFRYYSVLSAERAETQLLAARAAVVLSEAWRAQKGAGDFDPTGQGFDDDFQIQPASEEMLTEALPSGAILLGTYQVEVEGHQYQARLFYQNSADVPNARMLYVLMNWLDRRRFSRQYHLSTLTQTRI